MEKISTPITIVIPVHNSEKTLEAVLEPLSHELQVGDELIVVDDRSEDGSRDIAARSGAEVIFSSGSPGAAGARNTGASAAACEWVLFVDSDAVAPAGWREMLGQRIDQGATAVQATYSPVAAGNHPATFYKNFYYYYSFSISVGRLDYLFTGYERSKSSKKINAIERGLLVNQVMPAEVVGAHLSGKQGRFSYHAGWFSGSIEQEFDDFNSGSAAVIGAGYDTSLLYEKGRLHLDYLHNPSKSEGNAFRSYRHVVSLWHHGESGRLGMGVDLTLADPLETDGHVFGLTIEPTWMLSNELFGNNDPLQLAVRYQYATSNEDNGLSLQRRYEQKVATGEGNQYQAFYAGLNYFLYGHKLKLMAGGEYAHMKDKANDGGKYRGWTWFGALRLYF